MIYWTNAEIYQRCLQPFSLSQARFPAANVTTHFATARKATGLVREMPHRPFMSVAFVCRLHAKQPDEEFVLHHPGLVSREKCEKIRDTRGREWAIISN